MCPSLGMFACSFLILLMPLFELSIALRDVCIMCSLSHLCFDSSLRLQSRVGGCIYCALDGANDAFMRFCLSTLLLSVKCSKRELSTACAFAFAFVFVYMYRRNCVSVFYSCRENSVVTTK